MLDTGKVRKVFESSTNDSRLHDLVVDGRLSA
jgi:hypothetical protein